VSDARFAAAWKRTREQGFWRYILLHSALRVGGCALLVAWLFARDVGAGARSFAAGLVLFTTIGVMLVPFTWRRHEARYRRIVTDEARMARAAFD
jgi:hypothetical protein